MWISTSLKRSFMDVFIYPALFVCLIPERFIKNDRWGLEADIVDKTLRYFMKTMR